MTRSLRSATPIPWTGPGTNIAQEINRFEDDHDQISVKILYISNVVTGFGTTFQYFRICYNLHSTPLLLLLRNCPDLWTLLDSSKAFRVNI